MADAGNLVVFGCIGLGIWIFQHELRATLLTRQRSIAVNLRDGDRLKLRRSVLVRGCVAATSFLMVILLTIIALR